MDNLHARVHTSLHMGVGVAALRDAIFSPLLRLYCMLGFGCSRGSGPSAVVNIVVTVIMQSSAPAVNVDESYYVSGACHVDGTRAPRQRAVLRVCSLPMQGTLAAVCHDAVCRQPEREREVASAHMQVDDSGVG